MRLYIMYFSPTGGTKKAAERLGRAWDCGCEEIDLLIPETAGAAGDFTPEDICIVAVPAFGGRVPAPALARIKGMNGGGAAAVPVAVYGNREFEDTLLELKDALDGAGFHCPAAVAAVAQHSIFPQFGTGRPDEADLAELDGFARQIRAVLEKGAKEETAVPGDRPYRKFGGVPMKPKGDRHCQKCGKCASECPVQAIPQENPANVDPEKCISCMRCIAACPVGARRNSRLLLAAAGRKLEKECSGRKENKLFL